jgi:hypothetical protein
MLESLPNYDMHSNSPRMGRLGVEIVIEGATFELGRPIVLRGAYSADQALLQKSWNEPLTWTVIIVVRRDEPMVQSRVVMESHNLTPPPDMNSQPIDPSVRQGGFFNLDLSTFLNLRQPGRYWIMVSLGDHVSQRIEFEITNAQK